MDCETASSEYRDLWHPMTTFLEWSEHYKSEAHDLFKVVPLGPLVDFGFAIPVFELRELFRVVDPFF